VTDFPDQPVIRMQSVTHLVAPPDTGNNPPDPPPAPNIFTSDLIPEEQLAQCFTKKQLKQRNDWPVWEQSIYKQRNQYWNQGMFSHPMPLPKIQMLSICLAV
jgi:hypothetical protein